MLTGKALVRMVQPSVRSFIRNISHYNGGRKSITVVMPDSGLVFKHDIDDSADFKRLRKDFAIAGLYRLDDPEDPSCMRRKWEKVEDGGMYQAITPASVMFEDDEGRFKAQDKGLIHEGNEACLRLLQHRYNNLKMREEGLKLKDGPVDVGELDGFLFDDDTKTAVICEAKWLVRVLDKIDLYKTFGVSNGLPKATTVVAVLVGKYFLYDLRKQASNQGIIVVVSGGAGNWRIFGPRNLLLPLLLSALLLLLLLALLLPALLLLPPTAQGHPSS
ncbi:hypothetical protein JKP88DRAFT_350784 [Tribonema minus]|uniref:Uncharacterized protein n=1 Tax=Tribonema minus TaxID=303371 RepID=A0A835YLY6_9STRA|nr:hypothetical protein JKP88DRAFT_350784 [Tribonema minus]